ncbi:hypothetical protein L1887_45866 [Cichorium endivia]|nr:hypothetical protein L1887_45866 [Cichorium endivia]
MASLESSPEAIDSCPIPFLIPHACSPLMGQFLLTYGFYRLRAEVIISFQKGVSSSLLLIVQNVNGETWKSTMAQQMCVFLSFVHVVDCPTYSWCIKVLGLRLRERFSTRYAMKLNEKLLTNFLKVNALRKRRQHTDDVIAWRVVDTDTQE